jgi:hypothetical protein
VLDLCLAQRGYVPDRNLTFDRRGAQFHFDQLPKLVDELLASRVDVIVATCYPAAAAAQQGTKTIPIVSTGTAAVGLINSLSRPSGNLTGMSDVAAELSAKRLELLKEAMPQLRHVAMLYNAGDLSMTRRYQESRAAAEALGPTVQPLPVSEPEGFDEAFEAMTREPPGGLFMVTDALTFLNRRRVFDFAAEHRLPERRRANPARREPLRRRVPETRQPADPVGRRRRPAREHADRCGPASSRAPRIRGSRPLLAARRSPSRAASGSPVVSPSHQHRITPARDESFAPVRRSARLAQGWDSESRWPPLAHGFRQAVDRRLRSQRRVFLLPGRDDLQRAIGQRSLQLLGLVPRGA